MLNETMQMMWHWGELGLRVSASRRSEAPRFTLPQDSRHDRHGEAVAGGSDEGVSAEEVCQVRREALQRQPFPIVQASAEHDEARIIHFHQPMPAMPCSKGGSAIVTPKTILKCLIWVTVYSNYKQRW